MSGSSAEIGSAFAAPSSAAEGKRRREADDRRRAWQQSFEAALLLVRPSAATPPNSSASCKVSRAQETASGGSPRLAARAGEPSLVDARAAREHRLVECDAAGRRLAAHGSVGAQGAEEQPPTQGPGTGVRSVRGESAGGQRVGEARLVKLGGLEVRPAPEASGGTYQAQERQPMAMSGEVAADRGSSMGNAVGRRNVMPAMTTPTTGLGALGDVDACRSLPLESTPAHEFPAASLGRLEVATASAQEAVGATLPSSAWWLGSTEASELESGGTAEAPGPARASRSPERAPDTSTERIRSHAEWAEDGLRLWLGIDADPAYTQQALTREVVQELRRWLERGGLRLVSVVCNGQTAFDVNDPGPGSSGAGPVSRPQAGSRDVFAGAAYPQPRRSKEET